MKIENYHVSQPIEGLVKQYAIWVGDGSTRIAPLVYLQRPKWIKDDKVWEHVVQSIRLELPKGYDAK